MTSIVCNHEWSFLEGEKKHSHTLKAGRHLFPFQLQLGGSLPSTLYTSAYGGASVAYKLRATATRPGFAHNLQTHRVITLLRSFVPEAVEYQQSLEIENTWPEKIMYSIMVPHKAWAAGDDLTAVVKLSPLAKGVRALNVVTTLNETTKVHSRMASQNSTRLVITTRHEFRNGQAVCVEHQDHRARSRSNSAQSPSTRGMLDTVVKYICTLTLACNIEHPHPPLSPISPPPLGRATPFVPTSSSGLLNDPPAHYSEPGPSALAQPSSSSPNAEPGSESHSIQSDFELSAEEIVTKLDISLPLYTTPTHTLEPIIISHRIRWSILISNPDGHTSELRCSLPLHILDPRLIDEARSATVQTRRLLLGGPEVPEGDSPEHEQLPSYPSHIRDRIANMYLPDQAVMRVTNPWIHQGIRPVQLEMDQDGRHSDFTSGADTPLEAYYVSPPMGHGELEYVNSELLLSLSQNAPPPLETATLRDMGSPPETAPSSRSASRRTSQAPSRVQSRAPSPDREPSSSHHHHQQHSRRSSAGTGSPSSCPDATAAGASGPSTHLHASSTASRNVHGLFHATLRPLTSLTSSFALPSRHYPPSLPHSSGSGSGASSPRQQQHHAGTPGSSTSAAAALPRTVPVTSQSQLHRAFTLVPDYGIASRGFLGGVTPLETMQGLPSYEEAEMQRSQSEPDLASMAHHRLAPLLPLRSDEPEPSRATD